MKITKFLSAALFVFAAISCNTENILEPTESALEPMYISGTATKTVFTPADGSVSWTAGDQLAIFDNLGGKNFFNNSETSVASFSGQVKAGTTKFWGVYPAGNVESENTADGKVIVNLPADQTPAAGTFAEDLNISVTTGFKKPGTPSVDNITFYNVCGLISFKLPERIAASKVTFTANRDIAGKLSVDCEAGYVEIVEKGSKSVSMSGNFTKGSTFYFVVTPGEIKGFSIHVETILGSEYRLGTAEGVLKVDAGGYINLPNIDLKDGEVSVSASHTYSNDGVLTGSSLTVNHGIPSQLWKDVTNFTLSVKNKKDGKEYRSYNGSVDAASVTPEGKDGEVGKIYLPQGTYEITGSYTMNGVQTKINTTVTVPAPTGISLTSIKGVTSYSLATGGDVENANKHQADRIIPTATVSGVSETVLNEVGLSYTFSLSNGKSVSGTTNSSDIIGANIDGNAWATHALTASGTFDGVSVAGDGPKTCHITGLPYTITTTSSNPSGWVVSNTSSYWNTDRDYLLMKTENSYMISPKFHTPDSYSVKVVFNAYAYKGWSSYNPKVTFMASSTGQKGSDEQTITSSDAYPYTAPFKDYTGIITFNNSVSQACIYTSGKYGTGVAGFTRSVVVHHISINYSN